MGNCTTAHVPESGGLRPPPPAWYEPYCADAWHYDATLCDEAHIVIHALRTATNVPKPEMLSEYAANVTPWALERDILCHAQSHAADRWFNKGNWELAASVYRLARETRWKFGHETAVTVWCFAREAQCHMHMDKRETAFQVMCECVEHFAQLFQDCLLRADTQTIEQARDCLLTQASHALWCRLACLDTQHIDARPLINACIDYFERLLLCVNLDVWRARWLAIAAVYSVRLLPDEKCDLWLTGIPVSSSLPAPWDVVRLAVFKNRRTTRSRIC
jgi:hypothetical protein